MESVSSSESSGQRELEGADGNRGISDDRRTSGLDEVFGDFITNKKEGNLRIGFQNFSGFSNKNHDPVDQSLRKWVTEQEFDVFGISETNLFWPNVKKELQMGERISGWWNPLTTRVSIAYNKQDKEFGHYRTRQYGGVAQISLGNAALKFQGSGRDPRELGRWTWHWYKGTNNKSLRIITAYRPCQKLEASTQSVFTQQCKFFNQNNLMHLHPRQCILDNLEQEINQWRREGDNVILMMDVNQDVRHDITQKFLERTGMRDSILEKFGNNAPRTYISGSTPIDGIFTTQGVVLEAGGYASFSQGVIGIRPDHRCLWIEVKISQVLGHKMPGPQKFAGRRCQCEDPRVYKKFNKLFKEFVIKNNLSKRIFELERIATYPLTEEAIEEAEKIAEVRLQGIAFADHGCRKIHMGKHMSSPEYRRAEMTVAFWNLAKRKKEGAKVNSKILLRFLKKSDISNPLQEILAQSLEEICEEARNAYKAYRVLCQTSEASRKTWLASLAEARAEEASRLKRLKKKNPRKRVGNAEILQDNKANANEIRNLMARERTRKIFSRIRMSVGKENLAALSTISVPDVVNQDGTTAWKEISKHDDIVEALIVEHTNKYHQTEGTPPMSFPVQRQIGYLGIGEEADKILQGQYERANGTDDFSAILLKALSRVNPTQDELRVGITGKEFTEGWNKIKERTSSGGSICHFGHCKAMAKDEQLAEMEAAFLSFPLRTRYSYNYWRKGIDCVLPKKQHSNKINALRTIVLLEASFNFTNKVISRKVARKAEAQKGFAEEQFGSRKSHRAIDHALNKRITLDLLRQNKIPGVLCPNDLKSCYDRICHSIASLCMRRQGLAESESVCMFSSLQFLEHTIRCAYGDSKQTYGNEIWAIPMQGVYQGNGSGPVVWAVVSSPILQIMREMGYGTFFKASISGTAIRLVGYAFVDNTDLIQTARNSAENIESVIGQMQQALNLWEGLIKATGGALSVEKCCWWSIDFNWQPDGSWKYKKISDTPGMLKVRDGDNVSQNIARLEVSEAFETLGVFLAPDGNQSAQLQKMESVAKAWAGKIKISHLCDQEAMTALQSTILKTIEYPLLTTHFSKEQLRKIMAPVLVAALPKAKFNRHFCRKTLFAPGSHLGVGLHQVHTTQIIDHVDGILRHATEASLSGKLMHGSIEASKLELGLSGQLLM